MANTTITERKEVGDAVLERLSSEKLTGAAKAAQQRFGKEHARYLQAAEKANDAHAARDAALKTVKEADDVLDPALELLAQKAAGARLGTRIRPLAAFTKRAVSDLAELAYGLEANEVLAMCAKIAGAKVPKEVVAEAAKCKAAALVVKKNLTAVVKPQAAYAKAMAARDELIPAWTKALDVLKKHASAQWAEDRATYDAVFAPPDAVVAPHAKRSKKSPPKAQPADPAVA